MAMLTLNYWVRGQDVPRVRVFQIRISKTKSIAALSEAIRNKDSDIFHDVGAHGLDIYKPRHPVSMPHKENLRIINLAEHGELLEIGPVALSEVFPGPPPKNDVHIIVDAPYLEIDCWLRSSAFDAKFHVSIRANATTSQLKDRIRASQPDLRNVADQHIRLYMISGDENKLRESLDTEGDGESLQERDLLPNLLGVPVLDPFKLRIVVEDVSSVSKGKKRALEEVSDDAMEFAKRARIANEGPSKMAQVLIFKEWRKRSKEGPEELIDHRRPYKVGDNELFDITDDFPPISLQYEGFGHFLDIFRGDKNVPGMESVPSARIRPAVDIFAERMSLVYDEEHTRIARGLAALNDIFSVHTDDTSFQLTAGIVTTRANSLADGHLIGPHGATTCITEFKNEPAGLAIPYVEMTSYLSHSSREATLYSDAPSLMNHWNYPCLGLTIIGHYVTFYGMIYYGRLGWRVVALTPGLSCIRASGDGDDRIALYNAFTAALVLLARINQDAKQLAKDPPPKMQGSRVLPPISSLCRPRSKSCIELKILEFFPSRTVGRLLYTAKMTEDGEEKDIIVKFTQHYSYELHMFCADRGHAPRLLGFQRLPGGFFGIAMEFVKPVPQIKPNEWRKQLQELVKSFHAEGLVHGDLRSPNIIYDGSKVMVIDFDWAGKEGDVYYPHGQLNPQLTEDRKSSTDLKITKDDDLRVLCKTLRSMQLDCDYCTP